MSDTPRTDEFETRVYVGDGAWADQYRDLIALCRELERQCHKSGTDLRTRVKQLNDAVWFLGLDEAIKIVTPYNSRGELVAHVLETAEQRANFHKPVHGQETER